MGGCYELYIHSNTDSFVIITGFLSKAGGPHTIENRGKRYYTA